MISTTYRAMKLRHDPKNPRKEASMCIGSTHVPQKMRISSQLSQRVLRARVTLQLHVSVSRIQETKMETAGLIIDSSIFRACGLGGNSTRWTPRRRSRKITGRKKIATLFSLAGTDLEALPFRDSAETACALRGFGGFFYSLRFSARQPRPNETLIATRCARAIT